MFNIKPLMNRIILFISLALIACSSCTNKKEARSERLSDFNCDGLSEKKDYATLTGTLIIDSKGDLVFKSITDNSLGIYAPTFLIPCSKSDNSYIEGQYLGFASIRGLKDDFWITIGGKYINLQHYKNQDEDFERLEFLYDWVAIGEDTSATYALNILDSINSINQNDLIKINTRGCRNNCLPKESFYKLTNYRQELYKLEFDIVWHDESKAYNLVHFVR
jgi:hypothetical protein